MRRLRAFTLDGTTHYRSRLTRTGLQTIAGPDRDVFAYSISGLCPIVEGGPLNLLDLARPDFYSYSKDGPTVTVTIDGDRFELHDRTLLGYQIRALGECNDPSSLLAVYAPERRKRFLWWRYGWDYQPVQPLELVTLQPGMRFVTYRQGKDY